ncbi:MAG: hypothetical protein JJ892_09515 [Balneola sp.]|nr:hypothetical protein [Balneola sp.]MBO6649746.1 hypothetical protein [Balneola sp.]MBO6712309.1 hypothetical protein [Balneola sp.]MBO6800503.1 hypothetical protein [Balneola sp.]MBO6871457.1 hypothetical protein [Balneola sp.]
MERISDKDIEWLLKPNQDFNYKTEERLEKVQKLSFKRKAIRLGLWALLILTLTIFPFFLLIKTSIYLNIDQGLNGWVSLFGGIGATVAILLVYVVMLFRKVKNKKLIFRYGLGGVAALVGGFCLYGLLYVSSVNAKSDSVKEVYRSLHPILRVAVATTTLAEGDLVITDIKRSTEDYTKMGLPINQSSLHFPQPDGYVHAIDLRTKGHSEFRNFMLSNSLRLMGFKTLRHVGSADHLHISLPYSEH